jgi:hypothetical protein
VELADAEALARYLRNDRIAELSAARRKATALAPTCQRWLDDAPAKRLIFDRLYGDLLDATDRPRVLDVGGGLTLLTAMLAASSDYTLLDPLHHDTDEDVHAVRTEAPPFALLRADWQETDPDGPFDAVVASDLFPNVDQRLALFLAWAAPRAREIRLSLTFYNTTRWYRVKRVDADEQLCVLAYDGAQTRAALAPFAGRAKGWRPELFEAREGSLFANGRQVVLASFAGDSRP